MSVPLIYIGQVGIMNPSDIELLSFKYKLKKICYFFFDLFVYYAQFIYLHSLPYLQSILN